MYLLQDRWRDRCLSGQRPVVNRRSGRGTSEYEFAYECVSEAMEPLPHKVCKGSADQAQGSHEDKWTMVPSGMHERFYVTAEDDHEYWKSERFQWRTTR